MRVLEVFSEGRDGCPSGGEDLVVVGDGFCAVLDGVSARGEVVRRGLLLDGLSPGRWAAEVVAGTLGGLDGGCTAEEAFLRFSEAVRGGAAGLGVDLASWGWPAAVQVCVFSALRREVWRLGDVQVAVSGREIPSTPTPIDRPAADFRSALLWAALASGVPMGSLRDDDPSRAALAPLLELQPYLRNCPDPGNPFAHWLVDGRGFPAGAVQVVPVPPGAEVVMVSDGFLSPASSLASAERELSEVRRTDPLMIGEVRGLRPFPSGSGSFDDRSYVRIVA